MMTQLTKANQQTNVSTETQLPVGWIGDSQGGLKWLRGEVEKQCELTAFDLTDKPSSDDAMRFAIENARESGLQRLIFSANNRSHLDSQATHRLQAMAGEIPLAIACASWLDGSRRTGMGETGALLLPWNRWWDGWHEWLSKPTEQTLSAWTSATAHITAPERTELTTPPSGLIIADCWQTAVGWRDSVADNSTEPSPVDCVSSRRLPAWHGEPKWILLDDTAECMQAESKDGPAEAACSLRKRFPDATIVIATTICRSDQWLPLQAMPNCETIAKPSTGRSLRNLLHHLFR